MTCLVAQAFVSHGELTHQVLACASRLTRPGLLLNAH